MAEREKGGTVENNNGKKNCRAGFVLQRLLKHYLKQSLEHPQEITTFTINALQGDNPGSEGKSGRAGDGASSSPLRRLISTQPPTKQRPYNLGATGKHKAPFMKNMRATPSTNLENDTPRRNARVSSGERPGSLKSSCSQDLLDGLI